MYAMFDATKIIKHFRLKNFDTSNVAIWAPCFLIQLLRELNVSSFDTSNVTQMGTMFSGTSNLNKIDLRNFNTTNVETMWNMFEETGASQIDISSFLLKKHGYWRHVCAKQKFKKLTLGKRDQLKDDMNIPDVPTIDGYTGHWQNVGNGTVDEPAGNHVWTSAELMSQFNAPTMGDDTFVWQRETSNNQYW